MANAAALGERIWDEALALLGVRFRLHGRDVGHGLDCVGVAALACRRAGAALRTIPDDYRWHGQDLAAVQDWLRRSGLEAVDLQQWRTGDVLIANMGGGQWHVLIGGRGKAGAAGANPGGGDALVHAHASLRRVVLMPVQPAGPTAQQWAAAWRAQEA